MMHLFMGELQRYKLPAFIVFVIHIAALKYLSLGNLFAPSQGKFAIGILAYGLLGAALGLAQVGTYKRPNQWAYLIHRPLAPKAIAGSLMAAAALLFTGAIALPLLTITAYIDLLTPEAVDARHYLMAPYLLAYVLSVYLVAVLSLLSPNKSPIFCLGLVSLFLTREGTSTWLVASQLLILLALAALVILYFRPNLFRPPRALSKRVAFALSLQYGIFWVMVGGVSLVYATVASVQSSGWRSFADHTWNNFFPPGTLEYVHYRTPKEALSHGLQALGDPKGTTLESQLAFTDVLELSPSVVRPPKRHQPLILDSSLSLYDKEGEVQWTFKHDEMAFQGVQVRRKEDMGWMGPGSNPRFEAIPKAIGGRWVLDGQALYGFDAKSQALNLRMTLPEDQHFTSGIAMEGRVAATLSNSHLYILDPRDVGRIGRDLSPLLSIPIPGDKANLDRVQIAPLLDGYLLSFVLDRQGERNFAEAHQITQMAYLGGGIETLGDRHLESGMPGWSQYRMFWISPVMEAISDALSQVAGAPGPTPTQMKGRPLPSGIRWGGFIMMGLSGFMALVLTARRTSSQGERILWTLLALVFSIPGCLAILATHLTPEAVTLRLPMPSRATLGQESKA